MLGSSDWCKKKRKRSVCVCALLWSWARSCTDHDGLMHSSIWNIYGWEDNGWWVAIVAGVKTTSICLLTSVMGHNRPGRGQKPEINPEMLFVWMGMLSTWMNDRMWVISLYRMSNLKLTICASSAGSDNACCLAHKGSCTHKSSSNLGDKYNKSAKGKMNPQRWHPRPNNSPCPSFQARKIC